jgi:hypothetical protein
MLVDPVETRNRRKQMREFWTIERVENCVESVIQREFEGFDDD